MDLKAIEALATELLRDRLSLAPSNPRQKHEWMARIAELAGQPALVGRIGSHDLEPTCAVAAAAYLVGLAVGQRLQPNALRVGDGDGDEKKG